MRSATPPAADDPQTAVYAAMALLGQRWALRVIWELEPGPLGFLELRRRMGNCSSSVLADRLSTLTAAKIVEKQSDKSYEITPTGRELGHALEHVWQWADKNVATLASATRQSAGSSHARRRE